MRFSKKIVNVQMSGIRKMFDLATKDSINLGLGEPDFQPPPHVIQALTDAMKAGYNKYGPTNGIPPLRRAIADDMNRTLEAQGRHAGFDGEKAVTPDNIIVTSSGTEAFMATFRALFEKGDEVLCPNPGFVIYGPQTTLVDAKPVDYSLSYDNGFVPDIKELQELTGKKTKGLILNSPNNPTGSVISKKGVEELARFAHDNRLTVISDDVYEKITYEEPHNSFIGLADDLVVINSFSKTYALTGWRIGYIAAPKAAVEQLSKSHYYITACSPSPIQHAVLAALTGPQDFVTDMVADYRRRRDIIVDELNAIPGMECLKPKGAFYAFPRFSKKIKSQDLAMECLKHGLICSPGTAFGDRGEGHLRFSYAASQDNIRKGIGILGKVMKTI